MGNKFDKIGTVRPKYRKDGSPIKKVADPIKASNARKESLQNSVCIADSINSIMEKEFVNIIGLINPKIKECIECGSLSLNCKYSFRDKSNSALNKIKNKNLINIGLLELCKKISQYYENFGYKTEIKYSTSICETLIGDFYSYSINIKISWKNLTKDVEIAEIEYRANEKNDG